MGLALSDCGDADEIEITPEMIEAGLRVFRDRDAFDYFADETLEALIVEAFVAMKRRAPDGTNFGTFVPVAYYDKHMDCIRVLTHDRSFTEHRLDGFFTVYECNHRGKFDPQYIGFAINGVRHLLERVGVPLEGVYKLAELIDRVVRYQPGSTVSETLRLIFCRYENIGDLEVNLKDAA